MNFDQIIRLSFSKINHRTGLIIFLDLKVYLWNEMVFEYLRIIKICMIVYDPENKGF